MEYEKNMVAAYQDYLEGGGEMGELTRSFDWSATSVGHPDQWPQSLLCVLSSMFESRFPMFLWWGNDLIQFYNDAYRPSLGKEGKHPTALGQKGEDCWPEIWPIIKPLIDGVIAGGKSTWSEDQLIPIYRNNRLEDVYWTFSYSRVKNGAGVCGGVLVTCLETTEKVLAKQQTQNVLDELIANAAKLQYMLDDAPVAIGVFTGRDMIVESVNRKILDVWDKTTDIIGKPLHVALPELNGQAFLQLLDEVYTSGMPYFSNETKALVYNKGILTDIYFNFVYQPLKNMLGETFAVMVVASDITEQVVARKELEKIKDTLNLAIETSAIGVWTTELANNHLTLSPRARLIHGIPEGLTITWRESMKMIQDEFRSRVSAHISAAVKTGTSFTEEYWINPMNGSKPRWLRSNGKAYYNEDHKPIYVTGTILDITEQRQDEQRKNDFIGMVSHELKTPLTTLTALIQMLGQKANRANDDFSTGVLARAGKQVKTMNAMINGFLNVSRLESGKIQLVKKTFNLEELLSDVIEEFKLIAITHHIQVTSVERISVFADYDKIVSVFTNFLTNAIKYSPKGQQIDVVCKVCGNKAQVSVKDEGMGIKPEDLQRLFERYYRVESVENQHIAGFGLGLYLSAEIIKRHDGEIWAESENGAGSTFYFSLPL